MKKIFFTIAIASISALSYGQSQTKMDSYLSTKLQKVKVKKPESVVMLPMLIQGNINTIKQLVHANGGTFKYSYGNIAAIIIPESALPAFNECTAIQRMEGAPRHLRICNDTMRKRNSVYQVQQGVAPLPGKYNGKGIVLGFMDTGIDFKHPDFIDSNGHTRVKFYWDQNQPIGVYTPHLYGYGQAWNAAQIDANLASDSAAALEYGHGSNVAGAAASDGRANGQETGSAPQSDIVMVAINFNSQSATILTDAVNYIYTVADSLNEPCVINASLGTYDGSHDGLDLQALMIDSMILAKQPGRVFVAAAGNGGGVPFHLHDSLTSTTDTACTWFVYDIGSINMPIFSNVPDFNPINFAVAIDSVSTGYFRQRAITPYYTIGAFLTHPDSVYLTNSRHDTLAKVLFTADEYYPGDYSLQITITSDSTNYLGRLITAGPGRFDVWAMANDGWTDIVDSNGLMLSPVKYPVMKHYVNPDVNQTLCSSFQCSPEVITVANYFNRKCYEDYYNRDTCKASSTPGLLAANSSWGPTRNYTLIKPDISGAGNGTMSALPLALQAIFISNEPEEVDSGGWHNVDGGTSLASPGVAAVAALYMERYPTADYKAVWYAITHCDSVDGFTGAVPNYMYGYGKVDAYKALVGCPPITGIDEIVPPVNSYVLKAYPNPVSSGATIEYDFSGIKNFGNAQIIFYDMLGKEIKSIPLKARAGDVSIGKNTLSSGIYFYSLMVDGSRLKTEKLDVL
jgi:hypothetical protein